MPRERGLPPSVEQKELTKADRTNRLLRAIGPDREGGSVLVHQDAAMYLSHLEEGRSVEHEFRSDFGGYLFVVAGSVTVNGQPLDNGDAAMIVDEPRIVIEAPEDSELVMIEVQVRVLV
jgi:redox-sensitive bicupin YhaK (pirin superfamily)